MIYSIGFILLLLLLSNNNNNGVFGQQQQLWPSSIGSFSIPSLTQILSSVNTNVPQFDVMQMQNMPNFQMPSFRSMPSMGGSMPSMGSMASFPSPGASGSPSLSSLSSSSPPSSFSMPSFPNNNNFPSFQRPSSTLPSFPSAGGQGGNQPSPQLPSISQNNNNNQPQPQFPSLNNLPTPDPRVMQNALSSIGSSLNNIQQQIRPNSGSSSSSSNNNNNPSTSSLPPYPYTSDSVKIDAALRQLMPGYDTMTPAALQSTISSLSDKDMEAFQKEIGIDNTKFSKLSVFEAPFAPSSSCHQLDFGCQSYSSCFSCYSNRAQPKCGACLQLRSCSDGSLTCFLDGICRLCDASNNAPMCTTLQKRCANSNSGPPHP